MAGARSPRCFVKAAGWQYEASRPRVGLRPTGRPLFGCLPELAFLANRTRAMLNRLGIARGVL